MFLNSSYEVIDHFLELLFILDICLFTCVERFFSLNNLLTIFIVDFFELVIFVRISYRYLRRNHCQILFKSIPILDLTTMSFIIFVVSNICLIQFERLSMFDIFRRFVRISFRTQFMRRDRYFWIDIFDLLYYDGCVSMFMIIVLNISSFFFMAKLNTLVLFFILQPTYLISTIFN